MKFIGDLEIFGKVVEVECHCTDSKVIWKLMRGEDDMSDLLNIRHVADELHEQQLDHLANLKAGI